MPSSRQRTFRRPQPTVLPDIEPIIPIERAAAFNDRAWVFEPKHDGFRGLAYLTPDECTIHSKRGNRFKRFGTLCGPLRELVAARTAILDGEVLALDAEGRPVFMDLLRGKGRLAFAAFDILWLGATFARSRSPSGRRISTPYSPTKAPTCSRQWWWRSTASRCSKR
jgi:ATP-dependent DNA ligase